MKKQQSDQNNISDQYRLLLDITNFLLFIFAFTGLLCFTSCENDIEKINTILENQVNPEVSGKQYEIIYSDSGNVRVKVLAPEIRKYVEADKPYTEFPRGLTAYFYDDSLQIESVIQANYVIYFEEEKLWEAKNNVEARNLKEGNQLNTEHLFWNEKKRLIYSNTYSRIVNKDGTFYGQQGFEAAQDLKWWRLKGSKGTVNVKDE
ncbi:MAG: LPS export ABC transporter periplasmic protein LptC [Bacteroidales bacterium]|nr:LPS export ABC transporter periplasmic protein LptC [Bacteroidales bacterium]